MTRSYVMEAAPVLLEKECSGETLFVMIKETLGI